MFGRLHRPKRIELTCPTCGNPQEEPSLVYSSCCRACGEHFRVARGIAYATPGLRVSGLVEIETPPRREDAAPEASPEGADLPGGSWLFPSPGAENAPTDSDPVGDDPVGDDPVGDDPGKEGVELSAGQFFGFGEVPSGEPSPGEARIASPIGRRARSRRILGEGSMAAMMAGAAEEVHPDPAPPGDFFPSEPPRHFGENFLERPARCYFCHHGQEVPRRARSTQCNRCSAHIDLSDYEIRSVRRLTLRTRGDLTITRRGGLVGVSQIACHHLTVSGPIDATVDCSGDAIFRHSGTVRGRLHCDRLVIEKNCELVFPDGVVARSAEIAGQLIGDLTCSGKVRLGRAGLVDGRLTATDLEQREGGRVTGDTRIDLITSLPVEPAFESSAG